jgi:flagellar protein FlaG
MADIQKFISSMARQVRLSKDPVSGHIVVQLIDPNTGQLIRSLPSDELLRISRSFEMLGSVMVNQRA